MDLLRPKVRPYWHVDAKWTFGQLAVVALSATLLLATGAALTTKDRALELSATIAAAMSDKDGIDAPVDTTALRHKLDASLGERIAPFAQFPNVTITREDLAKSPRDLRVAIFRQIMEPVYELGVDGAAKKFTSTAAQEQEFRTSATALGIFTRQTHERLAGYAKIGWAISLIALLGMALFSWRFGRLANPGSAMVLCALPGAMLGAALSGSNHDTHPFGLPVDVMPMIGQELAHICWPVALVGLGLMAVAGLGRIIHWFVKHGEKKEAKVDMKEAAKA